MKRIIILSAIAVAAMSAHGKNVNICLADYGVVPGTGANTTRVINRALGEALQGIDPGDDVTVTLAPGRYDFYPEMSMLRTYYISNHDQDNPKFTGLELKGLRNVTLEADNVEFMMHGRMLPLSIINCENCTVTGLSIDFVNPQIAQVEIVANDTVNGRITYRPLPEVQYRIDSDGNFVIYGIGWELVPCAGIAFEGDTRRVMYNTGDINVGTRNVRQEADGAVSAPWVDKRLVPGTRVAMRGYQRPCPGIFMADDVNTTLSDVTVHYAEGMGLVAQMCDGIKLNGFAVSLRGNDDPRYFTTQADATHFSGCKGVIDSRLGLYEGMMDDAINVHGTYLKITGRPDSRTLTGRYMHPQTYGFRWGEPGDTVQFIASRTMEITGEPLVIESIVAVDDSGNECALEGTRLFKVRFTKDVDASVDPAVTDFGMENLTWTPSVIFDSNTVRHNRARGALFSTPRHVECTSNFFDHTSGSAVLLCGDCNGWFETGQCRDVLIEGNRFLNALTSRYQFTDAVISIFPEIPDLDGQKRPFHDGIVIRGNFFETFDSPLLFAKSVRNLIFGHNTVIHNTDYPPLMPDRKPVEALKVENLVIE